MQLLQISLRETEVKPWRSGNDACGSMRHRVQTRFRTRSKQQHWHTTHKIQNCAGHVGLNAPSLQGFDTLKKCVDSDGSSAQTMEHGGRDRFHTNGS